MVNLLKGGRIVLINGIVLMALLELASIIAIEGFDIASRPYIFRNTPISNATPMVADIDPDFGVWHLPNTAFLHHSPCFQVWNYYNAIGARDQSRSFKSADKRILLLGDSFVEGFGVDTANRVSNILQRNMGKEVLNFGVSGDFGTTQQSLLYRKFGAQYEHAVVALGILPYNDLDDNSIAFGKRFLRNRYRPYAVREADSFRITYHQESLEASIWYPENISNPAEGAGIKRYLRCYSYAFQILAKMRARQEAKARLKHLENKGNISRYSHFSKADLDVLYFALGQIKKSSLDFGAKMLVFVIPTQVDLQLAQDHSGRALSDSLKLFCERTDIRYLDLLEIQQDRLDPEKLFFECDQHWSPKGHEEAAKALQPHLESLLHIE
ncbi:MAG: SGNH/GDSL hydrolase family protein [Saprospiraceae bacterium]|nr:SGNH/GDSL hydrolase family protein [Saprospiraceae bacterium]